MTTMQTHSLKKKITVKPEIFKSWGGGHGSQNTVTDTAGIEKEEQTSSRMSVLKCNSLSTSDALEKVKVQQQISFQV